MEEQGVTDVDQMLRKESASRCRYPRHVLDLKGQALCTPQHRQPHRVTTDLHAPRKTHAWCQQHTLSLSWTCQQCLPTSPPPHHHPAQTLKGGQGLCVSNTPHRHTNPAPPPTLRGASSKSTYQQQRRSTSTLNPPTPLEPPTHAPTHPDCKSCVNTPTGSGLSCSIMSK